MNTPPTVSVLMSVHKGRFLTSLYPPEDNQTIQEKALAGHGSICHPSAMICSEAILKIGGYDENLVVAGDLDLWLRLGEIGKLGNLPQVVLHYRLHSNSISEKKGLEQRETARLICERAWKRRGIEGKFEATASWRPGRDRASRYQFALKYGWWAWNSGERKTALIYAVKALQIKPWRKEGIILALCSLFKSPPIKDS